MEKKLSDGGGGRRSLDIKINLKKDSGGEDTLLLTRSQIDKIERARLIDKSTITIPMSARQLKVIK